MAVRCCEHQIQWILKAKDLLFDYCCVANAAFVGASSVIELVCFKVLHRHRFDLVATGALRVGWCHLAAAEHYVYRLDFAG